MEVTDVKIKLASGENDNLLAYCSVIFDNSFVVTDLRIVNSPGGIFVSMPSRKVMFRCPSCQAKNHTLARFCNDCGRSFQGVCNRKSADKKTFVDTAHPIKAECRKMIVDAVISAYESERAKFSEISAYSGSECNNSDISASDLTDEQSCQ